MVSGGCGSAASRFFYNFHCAVTRSRRPWTPRKRQHQSSQGYVIHDGQGQGVALNVKGTARCTEEADAGKATHIATVVGLVFCMTRGGKRLVHKSHTRMYLYQVLTRRLTRQRANMALFSSVQSTEAASESRVSKSCARVCMYMHVCKCACVHVPPVHYPCRSNTSWAAAGKIQSVAVAQAYREHRNHFQVESYRAQPSKHH